MGQHHCLQVGLILTSSTFIMFGATEIESCCVCEWVILPRDELNLFTSDVNAGVDVGHLGHTTFGEDTDTDTDTDKDTDTDTEFHTYI
jgi:hypothetical protein